MKKILFVFFIGAAGLVLSCNNATTTENNDQTEEGSQQADVQQALDEVENGETEATLAEHVCTDKCTSEAHHYKCGEKGHVCSAECHSHKEGEGDHDHGTEGQ